jgi:hypothetical protein
MADINSTPGGMPGTRLQKYRDEGDGTHSEDRSALNRAWNAVTLAWQKLTIDNTTGGLEVHIVGSDAGAGGLTDAELRASAVPISAATLPLPTGAATAAEQATQTASLSVLDDWDESDRAKVNAIAGQAGVAGGAGAVGATTQRVVLATDTTVPNVSGDIAHDAADSGNPVKVGLKAVSALPTAVAANDRANGIADLFGRQLVNHIDSAMQVWKSVNVTTTQTGSDVWTPAGGKKIAITYLAISSYGTTGARVILWFGANADTTYTAGTDQLIWAGSFAPSASAKPGMVLPLGLSPIYAATADHEIHLTTDAGISLDITVYGYEF